MKSKREPETLTTPEGVKYPGWIEDDGVATRVRCKYADEFRASMGDTSWDDGIQSGWKLTTKELFGPLIAHHEKNGTPTEPQTGPDPLDQGMEMAERYLEYVAENADTLPEADVDAAHRLWAYRDNLRAALEGGDLRNAARAGVEFGRALEEMRVRLASTAVNQGRKNIAGLAGGRETNSIKCAALDSKAIAAFEQARRAKPNLDSERAWCTDAAVILNREHEADRAKALGDGIDPAEVEERWPKWTMNKVKSRIQRHKKERK